MVHDVTFSTAVTWHPIHPLLVSGGSEGAILHWDLSTPDPDDFTQPIAAPRATLSQAHDSNVWSLAFHPFGHILVSGSNDYTTRFWSRERPGDVTSVFSGGGEKPPDVVDTAGQDDDDEAMVPGFGFGGGGGGTGQSSAAGGGSWWGKEEDGGPLGLSRPPGSGGGGGGGGYGDHADDDFIPGFGAPSSEPPSNRQESVYGQGVEKDEFGRDRDIGRPGGSGGDEGWGGRSGGGGYGGGHGGTGAGGGGGFNRGSRFGPRRGGRY